MDMKTLTLIEEPTEEVKEKPKRKHKCLAEQFVKFDKPLIPSKSIFVQVLAEAEDEFERLLNEAE